MHKLMSELRRLYLPADACTPEQLEQRLLGSVSRPVDLADNAGLARALVIDFKKIRDGEESEHWNQLCALANALQTELGLPAPAVSISGSDGYGLWLSLETATPAERIRTLADLLHKTYLPDMAGPAPQPASLVELPPCLHAGSGKWAAFINPGLGASFAGESGLEMAPPLAGQVALLENLHSISDAQLAHAIATLQKGQDTAPALLAPAAPPRASAPAQAGLLLADATIDDIVRHLHSKNIEPTLRYLIADQ